MVSSKILHKHSDDTLKQRIESWITAFAYECGLFEKSNVWEEFWHTYKEEPLLTMMATGISRFDQDGSISIVREFPVYQNKKHIGRCDLFLNYNDNKEHYYIEAKYVKATWETGFIEWAGKENEKYLAEVRSQLYKYQEAYCNSNSLVFNCIVIFNLVGFKKKEDFDKYLIKANSQSYPNGYSYAYFHIDKPEESKYRKYYLLELAVIADSMIS
ncbi:hypothetical protein [Phnomibacter ginsenosidimutans]|uniref:Uncharacterized protein n=1 Tax=Phnomibacter ginsenosidimutans TaxID=2676868 RepID=A0A6I6GMW7_9BACT|nr:hypothetical protein [Phnomibacter ginsenosidimutans]QGW29885.1 hypothetical protein GLV81_18745 [Phnomibacter ginsenosidimutans]